MFKALLLCNDKLLTTGGKLILGSFVRIEDTIFKSKTGNYYCLNYERSTAGKMYFLSY